MPRAEAEALIDADVLSDEDVARAVEQDESLANRDFGHPHRHSKYFSCTIFETRFVFTIATLIVILLYWGQQPVAGFAFLMTVSSISLVLILRLVLQARFGQDNVLNSLLAPDIVYPLDPNDAQLNLFRLPVAYGVNSAHLRLAMMDRDFTPNDYEILLALDEEMRAQQFTGIPQSLIERLPTFTVPPARPSSKLSNPAPSTSLENPTSTPTGDDDSSTVDDVHSCAICLESKLPGEVIRVLPCLHSFHADSCIDPWLHRSPQCPVCKFVVRLN